MCSNWVTYYSFQVTFPKMPILEVNHLYKIFVHKLVTIDVWYTVCYRIKCTICASLMQQKGFQFFKTVLKHCIKVNVLQSTTVCCWPRTNGVKEWYHENWSVHEKRHWRVNLTSTPITSLNLTIKTEITLHHVGYSCRKNQKGGTNFVPN